MYIKKLEQFIDTFTEYEQIDCVDFDIAVDDLNELYSESSEYFTVEEADLFEKASSAMDYAATYFQAQHDEEVLEMERDERRYLTSQGNH